MSNACYRVRFLVTGVHILEFALLYLFTEEFAISH